MNKSLIFPKQNRRKRNPLLDTKNLSMVVLVLSLIVLILLASVISTCQSDSKKTTKKTYEAGIAAVTSQLAALSGKVDAQGAQMSGLSAQLAATSSSVATLSNSVSANQASIGSIQSAVQAAQGQLAAIQPVNPADVAGLKQTVSGLSARVAELEKQTSGGGLVAGGQSTTVNGLQVTSLINNVAVGLGAKTVPLAIRIANVNAFAVNKVDIAGTITLSAVIQFSAGYPTVSDGAGAVGYVTTFSASTTQVIGFEAYATPAGAAISIPAGGSITLRPVVTLGATAPVIGYTSTFTLAITAIAFDKGK